jgi:nitroreductase
MQDKSVEERLQWSKNQAYIALGNLMTVCAIEGIDACPMEGFVPEKCDNVLNLDEKGLKSVLLLPVGYRAEDDMFASFKKVRKSLEDTIIEIN